MIDRIDDFFNNLDPISAKTYAKIYFNTNLKVIKRQSVKNATT